MREKRSDKKNSGIAAFFHCMSSSTPNRARFFFKSLKIFLLGMRRCFSRPPASTLMIFLACPTHALQ